VAKKKDKESDRYYIEAGIDLARRVIFLDDDVDNLQMGWFFRAVQIMELQDPEGEITFIINSFGGEVYSGLSLVDLLLATSCPITTVCAGSAMSMGLILFLTGDTRIAYPSATFMAHEVADGTEGKVGEMKVDLKEAERVNEVLFDLLAARTKKTKKWWKTNASPKDFYFDTKKAKTLGVTCE